MITLEKFIKIMSDIQKQQQFDDKLTDLLVCKDSSGWINTGEELIEDIIQLLQLELNDEYDYINWWMWDFIHDDEQKEVYEPLGENTGLMVEYNLTDLKDLYYYITGELDKVKRRVVKEEDVNKFRKSTDIIKSVDIEELKDILEGKYNDLYNKFCNI